MTTDTQTLAPWAVSRHPARNPQIMTANATPWRPSRIIATVAREEDATLIAAAPDLYACLADILAQVKAGGHLYASHLEAAEKAIAKAKGR